MQYCQPATEGAIKSLAITSELCGENRWHMANIIAPSYGPVRFLISSF
ncbi:hypothetical protein RchiOBHm_Chr5g0058451 [Rosa chinensis]|uniref:Uncharacterized protein n=1 Tax=Rosa chinensis TaxID=74649 RepID=A0A2P6QH68_ROSCH|nr:hypothetical protein RchiOBHm_Chr5g0058451 [Rosa chinensis]